MIPLDAARHESIKAGDDVLLTIVNDVLDYSQMETGALRLAPCAAKRTYRLPVATAPASCRPPCGSL